MDSNQSRQADGDNLTQVSQVASVAALLEPKSIAVIGASRSPGSIGHEVFMNLLKGDFEGPVYPINPNTPQVGSVPTYSSVSLVPGPVDLAIVAIPSNLVIEAAKQCVAKAVKGLVVISAGFGETGAVGAALERELVEITRNAGIRLVGPNCMGIANMNPGVRMNATFSPVAPKPGPVAFMSQSGAVGIAVLQWASKLGLGISSFVSVGNKADVSGNDVIEYWEQDADTSVILLYLESFGNPKKFARLARRITRSKPIIAVKSGRSMAGKRAALSHTAAASTSDVAVDALFRQAGVVRVDTLEELFEVAQILAHQPLPRNSNVAIVSNSGGPGILAADACEAAGLAVVSLSNDTQESLRAILSPHASATNPVDMVASATAENYEQAVRLVAQDDNVGAVLVIFTPTLVANPRDVYEAVARVSAGTDKPIVVNFLALDDVSFDADTLRLPRFRSPEAAAYSLAKVAEYAKFLRTPEGREVAFDDVDVDRSRAIVGGHRSEGDVWLDGEEAVDLMSSFGLSVARSIKVATKEQAIDAARTIDGLVALKAAAGSLVHKSDEGGVVLGLTSANVGAACEAMQARLGQRTGGFVVQEMIPPGLEAIIGVVQDQSFGPLLMFGMGGTTADLQQDHAFRILPMTDLDASALVRSLKMSPLLFGYRGAPGLDVTKLEDTLLRFAYLIEQFPQIVEADLNPVIISPADAVVVDAKVHLHFD